MFFYNRKYPLVGRAPRKRPDTNVACPDTQEEEPAPSRLLLNPTLGSNESNEITQSVSTFGGAGESMQLRPLLSKSSRETQSDNSSKERKSVTINEVTVHHHEESSAEMVGESTSFVITPPSESARGRRRSGSTSKSTPK